MMARECHGLFSFPLWVNDLRHCVTSCSSMQQFIVYLFHFILSSRSCQYFSYYLYKTNFVSKSCFFSEMNVVIINLATDMTEPSCSSNRNSLNKFTMRMILNSNTK